MRLKIFFVFVWLIAHFSVLGQIAEYKKIQLSFRAGIDFPVGTSDTPGVDEDFMLPFSKGFGATFDGAYFFMKNFGVGLKYHLFSTKNKDEWVEIRPKDKYVEYTFNEVTHFIGPSFYGRWTLGDSKWEIPTSISIGYVNNKLSNYLEKIRYWYDIPESGIIQTDPDRMDINHGRDNMTSHSVGIVLSAGIRFRISSLIAIGVYTDGMFSKAKRQNTTDMFGESITIDFPRKINRVGLSAGLEFSF